MAKVDLKELKMRYGIVGRDEKLDRVLDTALQVARTNLSVLIQGESGVGKEAIPRIIHDFSLRKGKPYIAINCGSIPEGTIDSELFGHTKGAFTGAIADREGYFGAANGGTLFLDEVGELPLSTQVRLLRILETGEYVSVGSSQPKKTDVRIVAATNVKMDQAIRQGKFREDLYYRLCTISIKVPALRERGSDVLLLFRKFALDTATEYQIPEPLRLSPEAEQVMMAYKWPGNIRQLKNIVEQMSILCEERTVTPKVLADYRITPGSDSTDVAAPGSTAGGETLTQTLEVMKYAIASLKQDVEMLKQRVAELSGVPTQQIIRQLEPPRPENLPAATVVKVDQSAPERPSALEAYDEGEEVQEDEDLNIANMEKQMIERALRKHRNRRKNAAQELGLSERTLYRKIKDYGLEE
ncbi:MAG: sigma-54 dependent transcriptional regulator [Prevotellaceae bacterium]|nr:sigma-54 dependent transcriptional regulator [Prevotellaceae bacterium]